MYTAGGGGNSQTTVVKFQYIPGGHGGGGGWAPPTAGKASSISGRHANTTADTALRRSQGFMGPLLSVGPAASAVADPWAGPAVGAGSGEQQNR